MHRVPLRKLLSVVSSSFEYSSISYRFDGEHSNSCCSSQGKFSSCSIKTLVSMPISHGSFGWYPVATSVCYSVDFHCTSASVTLFHPCQCKWNCWFKPDRCVSVYDDYNQCEQTSCSVIRAETQQNSVAETNSWSYHRRLDYKHFHLYLAAFLGKTLYANLSTRLWDALLIASNLGNFILHDLSNTSPSSKWDAKPSKRRRNYIQHNAIQKNSVHRFMGAADINSLLSSLWCC